MKSLYESILSSTKSGKLATIKNWIKDNLFDPLDNITVNDIEKYFTIGSDGSISSDETFHHNVSLNWIKTMPEYIKFDKIQGSAFEFGRLPSFVEPKIFPKFAQKVRVDGYIGTIPSFKIDVCGGLQITDNRPKLKHIEPIELNFVKSPKTGKEWDDRYLFLDDTQIDKKDLDNIKFTGAGVKYITLNNTSMQAELNKAIKEIKKGKSKGMYEEELNKYLDNYFKNFLPSLQEVSTRTLKLTRIDMRNYGVWLIEYKYRG